MTLFEVDAAATRITAEVENEVSAHTVYVLAHYCSSYRLLGISMCCSLKSGCCELYASVVPLSIARVFEY
jgi:hypothetical protein